MGKKIKLGLEHLLYMQANYIIEPKYEAIVNEKEWFEPGPLYKSLGFVSLRYCKYDKHKLDGKKEDGSIIYGIYPVKISLATADEVLGDIISKVEVSIDE